MCPPLAPPEPLDPVGAHFKPRRVILFASPARGEAGPAPEQSASEWPRGKWPRGKRLRGNVRRAPPATIIARGRRV
jgi:hypothetical protein